jgi:hypothetical protein
MARIGFSWPPSPSLRTTSLTLFTVLTACAPPDPGPQDGGPPPNPHREDLDASWDDLPDAVQALGVATEPGEMAGTFARIATSATIVDTVLLDPRFQTGGGTNWLVSRRTWNEDEQLYEQESELCGGFNFEVGGVLTAVPAPTYRDVPLSTVERVRVDIDRGTFLMTDHLQLWALRDLPDPFDTPLPADADAAGQAPWTDRIYDMDGDSQPGITLEVSGLVSGEVYAAQRKEVDLAGVVSADGAAGFTTTTYGSVILGSDNPLFSQADPSGAETHPDPNESWFAEVRVDDGTSCADVLADPDALLPAAPPWL